MSAPPVRTVAVASLVALVLIALVMGGWWLLPPGKAFVWHLLVTAVCGLYMFLRETPEALQKPDWGEWRPDRDPKAQAWRDPTRE